MFVYFTYVYMLNSVLGNKQYNTFDLSDTFCISSRIIVGITTFGGNKAGEIRWCETEGG